MKNCKNYFKIILPVFLVIFMLLGCNTPVVKNDSSNKKEIQDTSGKILVHYIDVGQGDSVLIQVNNKNFLIDAGPRDSHSKVTSYLKDLGIKNIDYFLVTHPHEDHIGSASYVIDSFDIGEFYAPKKTYNTETYKHMINSLKNKNYKIHVAKEGVTLNLGNGVICEMLSPNRKDYENVNNYSPIVKLTYGNNKFIFTGDAESLVEKDVLTKNYDLSADVLKLGHHGSVSSTSISFLNKVNPKIAIASCGQDNKYGHPHKETITKLKKSKCKLYRTDLNGDILITGDGKTLTVTTEK